MKPKIVLIVGKSNSGKTTLLEKLITHLTQKGYKIGSVKHAHSGFEMDKEGKDSWRHKKAGAASTLVISEDKIAMIKDDKASYIEKMQFYLADNDIILAEGFKMQNLPKIEIFRTQSVHKGPLCTDDKNLIAFVTNSDYKLDVPTFDMSVPFLNYFPPLQLWRGAGGEVSWQPFPQVNQKRVHSDPFIKTMEFFSYIC